MRIISENKNTTNKCRCFLKSSFVRVKRLFALAYLNKDKKAIKPGKYYLPKCIIKNYNVIINGKNFYGQPINSDKKRYKEIRKLTAGQGEYYTTGCLLDYDCIKNYYRLIAIDLSKQKELHADPKTSQQIEFNGKSKSSNNRIDENQFIFVLIIVEKIKEARLKLSQGSVTVF